MTKKDFEGRAVAFVELAHGSQEQVARELASTFAAIYTEGIRAGEHETKLRALRLSKTIIGGAVQALERQIVTIDQDISETSS